MDQSHFNILERPEIEDVSEELTPQPRREVEPEIIRGLLQHTALGVNQTVIVARGPQMLAYRGTLKQVEALDVAAHVAQTWRDANQTERVQFMRLPLSPIPSLLLTFALRDGYRLILVDNEGTSLVGLRKLSNQLLATLEVAGIGRNPL